MDNIDLEIKSMFKFIESLENTKNNINTSDVFDDKYYSDSLNNANKINEKTFNELFESIKSYDYFLKADNLDKIELVRNLINEQRENLELDRD